MLHHCNSRVRTIKFNFVNLLTCQVTRRYKQTVKHFLKYIYNLTDYNGLSQLRFCFSCLKFSGKASPIFSHAIQILLRPTTVKTMNFYEEMDDGNHSKLEIA